MVIVVIIICNITNNIIINMKIMCPLHVRLSVCVCVWESVRVDVRVGVCGAHVCVCVWARVCVGVCVYWWRCPSLKCVREMQWA